SLRGVQRRVSSGDMAARGRAGAAILGEPNQSQLPLRGRRRLAARYAGPRPRRQPLRRYPHRRGLHPRPHLWPRRGPPRPKHPTLPSPFPIASIPTLSPLVRHEAGHPMGFTHSLVDPGVMEGGLWGPSPGPYADDTPALGAMYGTRRAAPFDASAPNTPLATA